MILGMIIFVGMIFTCDGTFVGRYILNVVKMGNIYIQMQFQETQLNAAINYNHLMVEMIAADHSEGDVKHQITLTTITQIWKRSREMK